MSNGEVINTFRYDDDGRLAEEWVQTDYRSFLAKLGVTATESAQRGTNTSQGADSLTAGGKPASQSDDPQRDP